MCTFYKIIAPFLDHFTFQNYILGGFRSVLVVSVDRANCSEVAAHKPSAYVWIRLVLFSTTFRVLFSFSL